MSISIKWFALLNSNNKCGVWDMLWSTIYSRENHLYWCRLVDILKSAVCRAIVNLLKLLITFPLTKTCVYTTRKWKGKSRLSLSSAALVIIRTKIAWIQLQICQFHLESGEVPAASWRHTRMMKIPCWFVYEICTVRYRVCWFKSEVSSNCLATLRSL